MFQYMVVGGLILQVLQVLLLLDIQPNK